MVKTTTDSLKIELKKVLGTRTAKRKQLIKDISLLFISICKGNGILTFPKGDLNFLVDELKVSNRQKQRLTKEIIDLMKSNKIIEESIKYTPIYTYRQKPLISFDYNSYDVLMRKNGYKKTNGVYGDSFLKIEQQGVMCNGNKSIVRDFCFYSEKKVYIIL